MYIFVSFVCQLDELAWVQISSNLLLFLVFMLDQNLERPLDDDDDLTLIFLDISEASKIKTRKSQGLLLSCAQVNSSSWQINETFIHFENVSEELFIKWIKAEIKSRHCEKATQIEKNNLALVLMFFSNSYGLFRNPEHICLWFPRCLKKPWCNLRYRFLWITSKCRGVSEAFQTRYFLQLESN